jgi:formate hydrogenlyase transcriptional activator
MFAVTVPGRRPARVDDRYVDLFGKARPGQSWLTFHLENPAMAAVPSPSRIRNEHEGVPALPMNPVGGYRLPATRRMETVAATVQSEEGLRFESLVIDLAAGFMNVDAGRVDLVIEDCLRRIVEALGLDRSTLFQRSGEGLVMTHSWAVPGFDPVLEKLGGSELPWCHAQIMSGASIVFARVDDLPEQAARDKAVIQRLGPKSNASFPLMVGDQVLGVLAFGSMRTERTWPPAVLERLRSVAHMVAGVLARTHTDRRLHAALAEVRELRERLERENSYLREQARSAAGSIQIVGQGPAIQRVLSLVGQVAPTDAPVLILGETGTGKELVAEAIHARSSRSNRTMVTLNCATLPTTLVEAELFGREKGAYTGALARQIGRFELAHGSTILLDEVGELPLELQAKLLRVLQSGEFERLGNPRTISVDVRIIAATNRDLEQAVAEGRFRADLYFRLAVFPIAVPPLRERPEDIPPLVRSIVDQVARKMGRRVEMIAESSLEQLQRYAWPGNIRELRNVVERAIILADGPRLEIELPGRRGQATTAKLTLEDVERSHILHVLELTGWRVRGTNGAGALLGLPPTTLETRMAKLGIRRPA